MVHIFLSSYSLKTESRHDVNYFVTGVASDGQSWHHVDSKYIFFDWSNLALGYGHGGYPVNRNVRYASHNMADAQGAKNKHVYFSIKTALNKMISVHAVQWGHSDCYATSKQITAGRNALLLMTKKSTCAP